MSYIKRMLEREYADGIIPKFGTRHSETIQRLLDDRQFARHGSTQAREAYKVATRDKVKGMTDEQLNFEIFG